MNSRRGKAKFKEFLVLLDSGFSYAVVMIKITAELKTKKMLQCNVRRKRVILPLILKLN